MHMRAPGFLWTVMDLRNTLQKENFQLEMFFCQKPNVTNPFRELLATQIIEV